MRRGMSLLGYFGLGSGLMYLLDPDRGTRRRAKLRDKAIHLRHQTLNAADVISRDLAHRTLGTFVELRKALREEEDVPDEILVERIRSKLGRVISHPHAVHVSSNQGHVVLDGLILADEVKDIILTVGAVSGVHRIENKLEIHKQDESFPGLQGGIHRHGRKIDILQENWAPATRFLVGTSAIGILYFGLKQKKSLKLVANLFSFAFMLRSFTNLEMRRLFGIGRRRAMMVHKTININAPVEEVYRFWSDFTNFPRFMTDVREVKVKDDGRSHWTVEGPAGIPVSWDAITTRVFPNELLAWKSVPGSIIQNAGRIQFRPNEKSGTRVDIDFSYNPPAGALGHVAAMLFGASPKSKLEGALFQMKTLIEEGPSERQVAGLH